MRGVLLSTGILNKDTLILRYGFKKCVQYSDIMSAKYQYSKKKKQRIRNIMLLNVKDGVTLEKLMIDMIGLYPWKSK